MINQIAASLFGAVSLLLTVGGCKTNFEVSVFCFMTINQEYRKSTWDKFCERFNIIQLSVDLFDCDQARTVTTFNQGKQRVRSLLKRSETMEKLLISEFNKVLFDFKNNSNIYDGLIYMMY
jgi:hypothetical protein